jgi:hypothetical protein
MKKYFLFDDEQISGSSYIQRVLVGSFLMFLLVGFWVLAATGYKRAGTFGWKKEYRIIAAILIPVVAVANFLAKGRNSFNYSTNLFDIFALLAVILHSVLLFKNGKKIIELPSQEFPNDLINGCENINVNIKYDNYGNLHYQIVCTLSDPAVKFIHNTSRYSIIFKDENNNQIAADHLPEKLLNENSKFYIKSGVLKYVCSIPSTLEKTKKIVKCDLVVL